MITHQSNSTEGRRQAIQIAIDARKSAAERNRLGQFATPINLALEIAGYVDSLLDTPNLKLRFADPSIGSGSFYSAALDTFGTSRMKTAVGIELDSVFANASRELWTEAGLEVIDGDFTRIVAGTSRPTAPNMILANPPYVRHHHLDRDEKVRLQRLTLDMTGIEVNGLAGLYVYFLLLATAWMATDGIAAWLIPSEFMDVNYGEALRHFLTNGVSLVRVHRFDPAGSQFGDALVSSVVLVFRKIKPATGHSVEFTFGGTLTKPRATESIPVELLRASRKWTAYPAHASNDRQAAASGNGPVLGDLFRIQRGIATGCNKFFILDRREAVRLGLPPRYLRPILPSPRHLKTTVVSADADGFPAIDHPLCVIDCDLPETTLRKKHPPLWEYLSTAGEAGVLDGYLIGKRTPWYKQEQRDPAPFLCTYMGRGADLKRPFRFIWNQSQAIGTNLYLMLYPRTVLSSMLRLHPDRISAIHGLLGEVTGAELRGEGRVYGGGLNKIEPSELARISASSFIDYWPELVESVFRVETASLFG